MIIRRIIIMLCDSGRGRLAQEEHCSQIDPRATEIKLSRRDNGETYVSQQLVRCHPRDDEQVPKDDLEIVRPKLAKRAPELLDVWVRIGELEKKK